MNCLVHNSKISGDASKVCTLKFRLFSWDPQLELKKDAVHNDFQLPYGKLQAGNWKNENKVCI